MKPVRLKSIRSVYETHTVAEGSPLQTGTRYTSAAEVYNTFCYLQQETKEHFLSLHLDGKNRILCVDPVSVGSLNQSIVGSSAEFVDYTRFRQVAKCMI